MPDKTTKRRDRRKAISDELEIDASPERKPSLKPDTQRKIAEDSPPKQVAQRRAMKRVGRTLRAGSASTVQYARKTKTMFDTFTHASEAEIVEQAGIFRPISQFFSKMTFPTFLLLSGVVVMFAVMAFSNSNISVDRQDISIVGLPPELEGYTIMLIGDLHAREFGPAQRTLLRAIEDLNYNMAVFTGDMVGAGGNAQPFYDLLEGLPASRPKFFIAGDSDPNPLISEPRQEGKLQDMVLSDWVLGAQQRGATYLSYTQSVPVGNQRMWLSPQSMLGVNLSDTLKLYEEQLSMEKEGVAREFESSRRDLPFTSYRYNTTTLTHKASSEMLGSEVHIALTHIPPSQAFLSTSQQRGEEATVAYLPTVDLVLSGHYCGGVWKFPGVGAIYIPNTLYDNHGWFPDQRDVQGVKSLGFSTQYTTAGLGVTDKVLLPKFRLMNSPQISLLTLTAKISNDLVG